MSNPSPQRHVRHTIFSDRVLVTILFLIVACFSLVQVQSIRLHEQQDKRRAVEAQLESQRTVLCLLDTSGAVNTEKIPYTKDNIRVYISECLKQEAR